MATTTSSCQAYRDDPTIEDMEKMTIEDMEKNPNFSCYKVDGCDVWYYTPKV